MGRITCRIHRSGSSGDPKEVLVKVGDWVRVRTDGGSPAARKYAGRKGRVTMIAPGLDETILDIRMVGNSFDTVLEEGDLGAKEEANKNLRRSEIVDRIAGMVNSDASDEAVLGEVVRLLNDVNPSWDWVGIYLLVGDTLVVGPHTGEYPEHSRIAVGEGVCGTAVAEGRNQVVKDVRERDNYLACSLSTRSEIVVLIREGGRIVGQFDVDSDEVAAFAEEDEALLAEVAELVAPRCASMARAL